jgi:hypothetical protein
MLRQRSRPGNRFTPQLEQLDDRLVPSCTWAEEGTTLTITGNSTANDIQITDDGTTLTITCDGEDVPVSDGITDVVVLAGNGNDTVTYDLTTDGAAAVTRSLFVKLGNGWDTFDGTVTGDLADGSELDVEVRGWNGKDTLGFAADGDVGAGSTLSVLLAGGNGKDVIDASYAGVLLGDLTWDLCGGNGRDEITGDLTFDGGSTGTADVEVKGHNAPDTLTLLVTDSSAVDDGDPATEDVSTLGEDSSFVLDGGRSHDSAEISDLVEVLSAKEHA